MDSIAVAAPALPAGDGAGASAAAAAAAAVLERIPRKNHLSSFPFPHPSVLLLMYIGDVFH